MKLASFLEPAWLSAKNNLEIQHVSMALQEWLLTQESLTERIRQASPTSFKLRVLRQKWQYPLPSEAEALGINPQSLVWVREVELGCKGQPWEFGRTVIPSATLCGAEQKLLFLADTPLGDILFKEPTLQRSEFELAKLLPQHYLYQQATHSVPLAYALAENRSERETEQLPSLWGRRSIFYLHHKPLLVTEVYTPWMPAAVNEIY